MKVGGHGLVQHGQLDKATSCCCVRTFCVVVVLEGDDKSPLKRSAIGASSRAGAVPKVETPEHTYVSTSL